MKVAAIIAAGGRGKRMGGPKQFRLISGKPMLQWTVAAFKKTVDLIIVATAKENFKAAKKLGVEVCEAGPERHDSVFNALTLVPAETDIVLIHDGARPLISPAIIKQSIMECKKYGAVVVGVPVKDTIKQIRNPKSEIRRTLDRRVLWAAQTPQVFKYAIIKKAYRQKIRGATDDSMLVEQLKIPVKMMMGSYENIKVTTPDDLLFAEAVLKRRKKND